MLKSLTLDNFFGFAGQNRTLSVTRHKTELKPAAWRFWASLCLAIACLLLSASYLVSVNSYAATGYQISKLQAQLSVLTDANKQLTVKTARVSSMVDVQSQLLGADFVPAGTPTFLQVNQMSMR